MRKTTYHLLNFSSLLHNLVRCFLQIKFCRYSNDKQTKYENSYLTIGAAEKAAAETRSATHSAQAQAQKTQGHAQGVADNVSGRIKSTVGAATGNRKMEAEGHLQQAAGDVRRNVNQ